VGQNAFAHEAGIHQHGILQDRSTYEIMRPDDVGFIGTNLVLGKHSGRHAFRNRIEALGHQLDAETFQKVFDDFIALADKKKEVYDSDIVALVENRIGSVPSRWKIVSVHSMSGTKTIPTATVKLEDQETGEVISDAAIGGGPVDAMFHAVERLTGISARLEDYRVQSVSRGKDALAEVTVEISVQGRRHHGKSISTDTMEASAQAFLNALNKADTNAGSRLHPQKEDTPPEPETVPANPWPRKTTTSASGQRKLAEENDNKRERSA